MIIGIPKEILDNENRVALTPVGVEAFLKQGHEVRVEKKSLVKVLVLQMTHMKRPVRFYQMILLSCGKSTWS